MADAEPRYKLVPYVMPSGRTPVQEFLDALSVSDPDAYVYFFDVLEPLIRTHGAAIGPPYFAYLKPTGFAELRWDGKDRAHHRIYCSIEAGGKVVLLHGVTKRWPMFMKGDKRLCAQRYADFKSADYHPDTRTANRD
jgi:phage-related protein